ncbi:hypothetical protein C7M84_002650 [Penaeus vannamei]|uniref:FCH and double SH3 domains protein 2 n=1 Tax=Penaeus vannamei TaxID=6689 RepID=A0A3R7P8Q0_PENVA|nr:hypothetical protein C7M84_002650 [Penaeus vannamei]
MCKCVWRTVLDETEKLGKARLAAVEVFQQNIAEDAKQTRSNKIHLGKKLSEQLKVIQNELQTQVQDLDRTKKVYYEEEHVAHDAREKASAAEEKLKRKKGSIFQSIQSLQKNSAKFSAKRDICDEKSAGARNDYLLALTAANTHQRRYYEIDFERVLRTMECDMYDKVAGYLTLMSRTELLTCSASQVSYTRIREQASTITRGYNLRCYLTFYPMLGQNINYDYEPCEGDKIDKLVVHDETCQGILDNESKKAVAVIQKETKLIRDVTKKLQKVQATIKTEADLTPDVEAKVDELRNIIRKAETNKCKAEAKLELLKEGGIEIEDYSKSLDSDSLGVDLDVSLSRSGSSLSVREEVNKVDISDVDIRFYAFLCFIDISFFPSLPPPLSLSHPPSSSIISHPPSSFLLPPSSLSPTPSSHPPSSFLHPPPALLTTHHSLPPTSFLLPHFSPHTPPSHPLPSLLTSPSLPTPSHPTSLFTSHPPPIFPPPTHLTPSPSHSTLSFLRLLPPFPPPTPPTPPSFPLPHPSFHLPTSTTTPPSPHQPTHPTFLPQPNWSQPCGDQINVDWGDPPCPPPPVTNGPPRNQEHTPSALCFTTTLWATSPRTTSRRRRVGRRPPAARLRHLPRNDPPARPPNRRARSGACPSPSVEYNLETEEEMAAPVSFSSIDYSIEGAEEYPATEDFPSEPPPDLPPPRPLPTPWRRSLSTCRLCPCRSIPPPRMGVSKEGLWLFGCGRNCVAEYCIAVYDYEATCPEEITFFEGQLIKILKRAVHDVDDGWWEGEVDGQVGLFPSLVVEECRSDGEPLTPDVTSSNFDQPNFELELSGTQQELYSRQFSSSPESETTEKDQQYAELVSSPDVSNQEGRDLEAHVVEVCVPPDSPPLPEPSDQESSKKGKEGGSGPPVDSKPPGGKDDGLGVAQIIITAATPMVESHEEELGAAGEDSRAEADQDPSEAHHPEAERSECEGEAVLLDDEGRQPPPPPAPEGPREMRAEPEAQQKAQQGAEQGAEGADSPSPKSPSPSDGPPDLDPEKLKALERIKESNA